MLISKFKKLNQAKSRNLLQMCIFCLLFSFKKGGKIQTGLNCEYGGLSEACLSLSHSNKSVKVLWIKKQIYNTIYNIIQGG